MHAHHAAHQAASTNPASISLPKMQEVESSQIQSIGYDEGNRTLYITFKNGGTTYRYFDVTPAEHLALMEAPSKGSHFGAHIRGARGTPPLKRYERLP
jgi:hypothetical protein